MVNKKRRHAPEPGQPTGKPTQDTGEDSEGTRTVNDNTEGRAKIRNESVHVAKAVEEAKKPHKIPPRPEK